MKNEVVKMWLRRARSNLARAQLGRQAEVILLEDLCFDAQQAAEKALKGLLIHLGIKKAPRSHSIGYLLHMLEKRKKLKIPTEVRDAVGLTGFAVATRYPGNWEPVDDDEYHQAVSQAETVVKWVEGKISQPGKAIDDAGK